MKIEKQQTFNNIQQSKHNPHFKGFTDLMMSNVFLNKTLFDLTSADIPWVVMANNNEERRERFNRAALSVGIVFVSPLIFLPLVNRLAMKHIAKLTPEIFSKNYNAIRLSNKYLTSAEKTKEGLKELAKEPLSSSITKLLNIKTKKNNTEKIDLDSLIASTGGDYEKLRKKIITAKNFVLACDFTLIAGIWGHIGFFNNLQTEKKTGQTGYSAELKMADKDIVEKRAAKYKRNEKIRYGIFAASLVGLIAGLPLAIRHGLISKSNNKFSNFIKKHSEKFDYNDAIFMKRLPLALACTGAHFGIFMASRNKTERKDNAIRSSTGLSIFFLGDVLLASLLGKVSDKLSGTKIIKYDNEKNFLNKILPPMKNLEELKASNSAKTIRNAKGIFWINFAFLSALLGVITPKIINKIVKKDVSEDVEKAKKQ